MSKTKLWITDQPSLRSFEIRANCYTSSMLPGHTLLELRTGRDNLTTPEAMTQVFAALPKLHTGILTQLTHSQERLSFELVAENQTIFFFCHVPDRLLKYLTSTLTASYPEIVIKPTDRDPLQQIRFPDQSFVSEQSRHMLCGSLQLKHAEYLPLKTFRSFGEIDSLAPLLSVLSRLGPYERVVIQFLIDAHNEQWKNRVPGQLSDGSSHPQQEQISRKVSPSSVLTAIRVVVTAEDAALGRQLLTAVESALQGTTETGGNNLVLRRTYVFTKNFLRCMHERSWLRAPRAHLSVDELATLYHLPNKAVSTIPNIAWGKTLLGEPPTALPIVTTETKPEEKKEINVFARARYKNEDVVYGLKRTDRRRHLYVIGKTGTGKSTLLANMAINDLKNNEGLCIIDPHGDLVETLLNYIPSHRINDVIYLDPSDVERTVQINLFEGENVVHRELIASGIVSVFRKLYGYSWGPRLEYILRNALLTLLKSPSARLSDIVEMLTNDSFRAKVVENLNDEILKNFWVYEFEQMSEKQRNEAIAPILNKVGQFVSSPLVRNVVNAHKSSFSIEEVMDQGKILLVNLSQGKLGEDNATLLGAMLITKIQLAAMARVNLPEENRKDFYLYVDEFQNFATESFSKILSEARKYRLNLVLANQYIAQIPEDVQKAIFGNCGSMIAFVMGSDDAQLFYREFGQRYSTEDLVSLGRYQVINKLAIDNIISKPFPADTLALATSSNSNKDKVIKVSRERYAKKKTS